MQPLVVNAYEIVSVNSYFAGFVFAGNEIFTDKTAQFLFVLSKMEEKGFKRNIVLNDAFYFFVNLFKFFGVVVGRRNIPVKIVLIEDVLNFGVGNESDFFAVVATQKRRRQDFVEGPRLADGQNQLRKHHGNIGGFLFCFRP
ncbi:MAG: hypothetical protein LBR86_06510 [Tannerella sp.]|nr:hypothetical protein [Tannerella sp.]